MAPAAFTAAQRHPVAARHTRRRTLIAAGVCSALLVPLIWLLVQTVGFPGDSAMHPWLARDMHPLPWPLAAYAKAFDLLGGGAGALAVPLLAIAAHRTLGPRGVLLALGASAVVLATLVLKRAFGDPPPELAVKVPIEPTYPSGHVAYATTVFGFGAWLAWRAGRRATTAALVAIVLLMGPARLVGAAHWPSDAAGGYALGAAWLAALVLIASWARARGRPQGPSRHRQAARQRGDRGFVPDG